MKFKLQNSKCGIAATLVTVLCSLFTVSAQSGGTYDLSHSVVAGGGGSNSSGGIYSVDATGGQTVAGSTSIGGPLSLRAGFWAFGQFAPTAAQVSISGRVTSSGGQGLRGVRLELAGADGSVLTAVTSTFGYYRFDGIEAGTSYVISVRSTRYGFPDPVRFLNVSDNLTEINFTASHP
ncbi:MAG: carboxypeptidase-like regulatory domain-containing protein [Pyrinomonadaceae bacterium]